MLQIDTFKLCLTIALGLDAKNLKTPGEIILLPDDSREDYPNSLVIAFCHLMYVQGSAKADGRDLHYLEVLPQHEL